MCRSTRILLVAVIATALLGSGCTSTVRGNATTSGTGSAATSSSPASSSDAVTWTNDICGALLKFTETASTSPASDPAADPAAQLTALSEYLGRVVTSLDAAISGMAAAGPSPVAGGDTTVAQLTAMLTTYKTSFQDAKDEVDKVDTTDPASIAALPAALAPLATLSDFTGPKAQVFTTPELDRAAKQAPNCKKVAGS